MSFIKNTGVGRGGFEEGALRRIKVRSPAHDPADLTSGQAQLDRAGAFLASRAESREGRGLPNVSSFTRGWRPHPGTQLSLSLSSTPPVPAAANGFILKLSPCLLTFLSVIKRLRNLSARPTVTASSCEFQQVKPNIQLAGPTSAPRAHAASPLDPANSTTRATGQ